MLLLLVSPAVEETEEVPVTTAGGSYQWNPYWNEPGGRKPAQRRKHKPEPDIEPARLTALTDIANALAEMRAQRLPKSAPAADRAARADALMQLRAEYEALLRAMEEADDILLLLAA
jgi:hypothetical protein